MKALRIHETGGLDKARIEDVPEPTPGPGEVRVRVRAAALNHLDIWVAHGKPKPPLPHTLGSDAAGVIDLIGEGVTALEPGQEVLLDPGLGCGRCERCAAGEQSECARFGILGEARAGTFAEAVVCPATSCHPKPAAWSFEEAAALGLTFVTAHRMLFTRARLAPGEDVLIHGIGGGVATSALVLAVAAGARVLATSGSPDKLARARALGASEAIDYKGGEPVAKAVLRLTRGRGVDVVVETAGKATWADSVGACRKGGRIVTCGATTGDGPALIHALFWKQLSVLGSTMGSREDMRRVVALAHAGRIRPVIDRVFPFDEALDALRRLERGEQMGKIVLAMPA